MKKASAPEALVRALLHRSGIAYESHPTVGGLQPDFTVMLKDGKRLLIETKRWRPTPAAKTRAARHARFYRDLTGLQTRVVIPDLGKTRHGSAVVGLQGLRESLASAQKQPRTRHFKKFAVKRAARAVRSRGPSPGAPVPRPKVVIFAAMPFARNYEDVYYYGIAAAAKSLRHVSAAATRIDFEEFDGDIVKEIEDSIRACDIVVADLSEARANVMYETGFAHALGNKPVIHISSTELQALPFDVRNWNTISYSKGQTRELKKHLARRLRATITARPR